MVLDGKSYSSGDWESINYSGTVTVTSDDETVEDASYTVGIGTGSEVGVDLGAMYTVAVGQVVVNVDASIDGVDEDLYLAVYLDASMGVILPGATYTYYTDDDGSGDYATSHSATAGDEFTPVLTINGEDAEIDSSDIGTLVLRLILSVITAVS